MDSLAYIPAPDGTLFLRRKPGVEYPELKYYLLDGDTQLSRKAPKSAVDFYMAPRCQSARREKTPERGSHW